MLWVAGKYSASSLHRKELHPAAASINAPTVCDTGKGVGEEFRNVQNEAEV